MSSQPWGNFSEILNQANEGYQRPFDPDGPHNVGEALFGDTFGFGGGADDLSLAYSVTNGEEVRRTLTQIKCPADQIIQSHYADDFEPSGQDTVETKQLNLELNDLLIQDDELQVINEAVERVRRQAARHYLHVRVNGGDKNHWRVGPDPLQNIQEEGVSADYIKTLLTDEVRNCHRLPRLLLTPSPIARATIRNHRYRCRRASTKLLQEDGALRLHPPQRTKRNCFTDAGV